MKTYSGRYRPGQSRAYELISYIYILQDRLINDERLMMNDDGIVAVMYYRRITIVP